MPITLLDGVLLGITLVSAVLAMVRGFSREVLSVASWAAAAIAAYLFYTPVVPLVRPYISNDTIATIAAAGAVFIVTLIIVSVITMKIADFIIDSRVGALDRTLGFVFGAARGVLLVVVAMLFFNWLVAADQPGWIANAKSKPLLDSLGQKLVNLLPEDPESTILNRIKPKTGAPSGTAEPEAPENKEEAPADGATTE
ncbi:colicin V synthesis protein [Phyllobacterium phragmitis]|uniref:Colicin V synthesis protein n=1 Tax=Phyllobacterium phragmitis TaxID=2670329 RepID=A0A2S9IZP8_9HYPH|nr:CvpA family protein [Phyllobacterium phragmitis]PRD46011.1 colicin V synthesis protein [Phyllobacterium phragmitis]